jgi:hypothetical protein
MTERVSEPIGPRTTNEPVEPTGGVARRNVRLALVLFGLAVLIAAGTVVVSLVYLHYD